MRTATTWPAPWLDYGTQLDRIINAGAAGGSRRIFLVMPHDWGRSPRYVAQRPVRGHARAHRGLERIRGRARAPVLVTRLVALDLFTAMECVFNQPADFGFTNVIQARPQGGDLPSTCST